MTPHPSPEHLGAYLDGELDAAARAALDAHLRDCAECGAHLVELSAVDDAARGLPLSVPEGYFDDFAPRVRARLASKAPSRWRPPVWGWAAAAALLLAVITPLALQDYRKAAPAAAPEVAQAQRDASPGREQERLKQMASPPMPAPATIAAPRAPRPMTDLRKDQPRDAERANDALLARDRVETGSGGRAEPAAPPPVRAEPEPKREGAAPQQERDGAKLKELSDEDRENLRALGYLEPGAAPPPPTAQRQHGPRSQGTVGAIGNEARKKASAAESKPDESRSDKAGFTSAPREEAAAGANSRTAELQESVAVTTRSRDVGQGLAWAKYRSLADGGPPRSDGDARLLREAWRTFASENPDHTQADEARVRVVEAGVLAYRLGRRSQDREIALRDGRAYLERPTAPQAARVRAALKTLEPAAP